MKKTILIIVVVAVVALGWYLLSPLVFDTTINEDLPFADVTEEEYAEMQDAVADMDMQLPPREEMQEMTAEEAEQMEREMVEASADQPDTTTDDQMPEGEEKPVVVLEGSFMGADNFHQGSGTARIYRLPDGSHLLRFEDFEVTNGPDLRVLLANDPDPQNRDDVQEGYIELAKLKGNKGNQNYEIAAGTDISTYGSVVIYCKPFHVIFSTATLQ